MIFQSVEAVLSVLKRTHVSTVKSPEGRDSAKDPTNICLPLFDVPLVNAKDETPPVDAS